MSSLLELQSRFRDALLAGDGVPPAEVVSGSVGAAARLGIYRNNVIGALTRSLRLAFPAVERIVGADFFAAAAELYVTAAPPDEANLYCYGATFPRFLAGFEPAAGLPYLADLARLEWAINCAWHAPAAPKLALEDLRAVPVAILQELRFHAHPALSLLQLGHPARAIWEAVLIEDAGERGSRLGKIDPASGGENVAVYRADDIPALSVLSPAALALAQALTGGATFGDAISAAAPGDAAPLLAEFLKCNFFAGMGPPEGQPTITWDLTS